MALPENAFLQKWSLNTEHGVDEGRLQKLRWEQRAPEVDVNPLENSDTEDRQTAPATEGSRLGRQGDLGGGHRLCH